MYGVLSFQYDLLHFPVCKHSKLSLHSRSIILLCTLCSSHFVVRLIPQELHRLEDPQQLQHSQRFELYVHCIFNQVFVHKFYTGKQLFD